MSENGDKYPIQFPKTQGDILKCLALLDSRNSLKSTDIQFAAIGELRKPRKSWDKEIWHFIKSILKMSDGDATFLLNDFQLINYTTNSCSFR